MVKCSANALNLPTILHCCAIIYYIIGKNLQFCKKKKVKKYWAFCLIWKENVVVYTKHKNPKTFLLWTKARTVYVRKYTLKCPIWLKSMSKGALACLSEKDRRAVLHYGRNLQILSKNCETFFPSKSTTIWFKYYITIVPTY